MAWLAKDKDGTEAAFRYKPILDKFEYNESWNDYDTNLGRFYATKSLLPKGSIKKLIEKDLTFEDGPIEI